MKEKNLKDSLKKVKALLSFLQYTIMMIGEENEETLTYAECFSRN